MTELSLKKPAHHWSALEITIFRVLFVYFMIQAVPLDWKYYRNALAINWTDLHYRDLFYLARYTPQVLEPGNTLTWGISTLADWLIVLIIATLGAVVWGYIERGREYSEKFINERYSRLYYVLRAVSRYRLAIAIAAYAFIKIFPMQQPYPSLSLLNTNYGEFTDWKVASFSYGVAPSYEALLGWVELLSAALLLHRKTASIGAACAIGYIGNVFLSNLGFSGGEAVYCLYLISLGLVILFYDAYRFYSLLVLAKPTAPNTFQPFFLINNYASRVLKATSILIVVIAFGYFAWADYNHGGYQYPTTSGLPNSSGLYNVKDFKRDNTSIPYSLTDGHRWQNVVFEKWNTISIRTNILQKPDMHNTEDIYVNDKDRIYESAGTTGRHFYTYTIDTINHKLLLRNKNPNSKNDVFALQYSGAGTDHILLKGTDISHHPIYVELEKVHKTYVLDESVKIPRYRSAFE